MYLSFQQHNVGIVSETSIIFITKNYFPHAHTLLKTPIVSNFETNSSQLKCIKLGDICEQKKN
jgi:hypothetical protein